MNNDIFDMGEKTTTMTRTMTKATPNTDELQDTEIEKNVLDVRKMNLREICSTLDIILKTLGIGEKILNILIKIIILLGLLIGALRYFFYPHRQKFFCYIKFDSKLCKPHIVYKIVFAALVIVGGVVGIKIAW